MNYASSVVAENSFLARHDAMMLGLLAAGLPASRAGHRQQNREASASHAGYCWRVAACDLAAYPSLLGAVCYGLTKGEARADLKRRVSWIPAGTTLERVA